MHKAYLGSSITTINPSKAKNSFNSIQVDNNQIISLRPNRREKIKLTQKLTDGVLEVC
jgi:ribosomal 50S subunit-associated protein YjgA (DUF615 family)